MDLPAQVEAAVRDALSGRQELVTAAAEYVRAQVPALRALPDNAVESFIDVLLGDGMRVLAVGGDPSEQVLQQLEPFVVQRAELGVAVDDILRGLYLGQGVVMDALLDRVEPELSGRQTVHLMRRIEAWLDLVRRQVLVVHRRTEIELAQAGRDRSSALLAALLDPQQSPPRQDVIRLGLDPDQPLFLTRTRPLSPQLAWAAERSVRAHLPGAALSGIADGDVVALSNASPAEAAPDLRQAVAGPLQLEDLPEAHLLLGLALEVDSTIARVPLVSVADQVAQARNPLLGRLLREALVPQIDPVRREHRDLLDTVAYYLAAGCRLDRTALALHVHVNTVKHRLGRYRSLTGDVLDDPSMRPSLAWAIRVALTADARPS